jgi:preprotein translocase subunit SecG
MANIPTYRPNRKPPQDLMENVVLIIHLLLALGLIGVVLMQRSEGGGLGMGGGGAVSGRSQATALSKVTWVLAVAFIITSITLTVLAAQNASGTSVLDRLGVPTPAAPETGAPALPGGDSLLPPAADDNAPLVPRAD